MTRFEYDITTHPSDSFKTAAYFCTENGECAMEDVKQEHTRILGTLLNERGALGWELVQVLFGKEGIMAIWKRILTE